MFKNVTIKRAVFVPFIITVVFALIIFIVVWRIDYNRLADEQGEKVLTLINENIEEKFDGFLGRPKKIIELFSLNIMNEKYYEHDTFEAMSNYTLKFMQSIQEDVPQISVVGYGNEEGNFLGLRKNDLNDFSLMMKENRTDYELVIYSGDSIESSIVASYEGYDPKTRPWYQPVKESPSPKWSEIYVNYDEKNETTISALYPIMENDLFVGVAVADVKLAGIQDFLKDEAEKSGGTILIVDEALNIIAYSGEQSTVLKIEQEGESPYYKQLTALQLDNELINDASRMYTDMTSHDLKSVIYKGDKNYVMARNLEEPNGFGWFIISILPESAITGDFRTRQLITIGFVTVVLGLGAVVGLYYISKFVKQIQKSTELAVVIADGNLDVSLDHQDKELYETSALIDALNTMTVRLKHYFDDLKLNEARYLELLENVEEMIYTVSADGKLLTYNKAFESFLGEENIAVYHLEEYISKKIISSLWKDKFNKVKLRRVKEVFQTRIIDQGEEKILNWTITPIVDNGKILSLLGSVSDVTELVHAMERITKYKAEENEQLEELVKERTEELEKTMRELVNSEKLASLGSLVSGVAHEINTPLGVSVTTASYIKKINKDNLKLIEDNKMTKSGFIKFIQNVNDSIDILTTNLARASDLIKSFKMIAVNQSHEAVEQFNLYNYLDATIKSLKHELKQGNHRVSLHMDEMLIINSYSGAYSQIFTNLIMNSIIHGYEDRDNGEIKIRVSIYGKEMIMTYEDDGNGIPKEKLPMIFDPFYTSNRGQGGTGLGLSVVYNLVTGKLGGSIVCESQVGMGALFTIVIPFD
jgi:PAS domain S-box-containing protein